MRLCCQLSAASGIIENQHYPILFVLNQPSFYQIYPLNHLNDLRAYLLGNWDFLITLARGVQQKNWPKTSQYISLKMNTIRTPKNVASEDDDVPFKEENLFRFHLNFLKKTPPKKNNHQGSSNPSKVNWNLTNGPLGKVLEHLDTQVLGVHSVDPVGDFLEVQLQPFFFATLKRCCSSKLPSRVLSWTSQDAKVQSWGRQGLVGVERWKKLWVACPFNVLKRLMATIIFAQQQ